MGGQEPIIRAIPCSLPAGSQMGNKSETLGPKWHLDLCAIPISYLFLTQYFSHMVLPIPCGLLFSPKSFWPKYSFIGWPDRETPEWTPCWHCEHRREDTPRPAGFCLTRASTGRAKWWQRITKALHFFFWNALTWFVYAHGGWTSRIQPLSRKRWRHDSILGTQKHASEELTEEQIEKHVPCNEQLLCLAWDPFTVTCFLSELSSQEHTVSGEVKTHCQSQVLLVGQSHTDSILSSFTWTK